MTSCVFFKFKSQKDLKRVEFDGTGISVFELKRDIIKQDFGAVDGTDFDLAIYSEDAVEYDDDTTVIPRSTTVIARRLPAMKPGAGRAARYISGKMPINAKNQARREQAAKAAAAKTTSNAIAQMNSAMTEEEKMNAMFAAQSEQWSAQQEDMSHQTPVFKPGSKKPANVPDHEPPNGYVCHRCGEKGHWIQQCPTNDNPEYDNRPRVKRTTGIPKAFLRTVDKATALAQRGADDDSKMPSGIMVNADGEFVVAEPDKAAWKQFQDKAKTSVEAQKVAAEDAKVLQKLGLECPIDHKMFIDPMKTPCCAKTYCNDCITNALIEGDLVCPGCQREGVLIDDLAQDAETSDKIEQYVRDKAQATKAREGSKTPPRQQSRSPSAGPAKEELEGNKPGEKELDSKGPVKAVETTERPKSKSPEPPARPASTKSPKSPAAEASQKSTPAAKEEEASSAISGAQPLPNPRKRSAEEPAENPRIPKAPKAMQKAQEAQQQQANMMSMMNGMNPMNGMNGFPPMGMPNMPPMGMMNPMMNPMMGMNGFNGMGGFPPMMNPMMNPMMGMNGFGGMNGGFPMSGAANNGFGMNGGGVNMNNGGGINMNGGGYNQGPRQPNFTQPNNDDDAYFRKPVNPHRHSNRQRRVRPSDYREL